MSAFQKNLFYKEVFMQFYPIKGVFLPGFALRKKKAKKPKIYCRKSGLFCSYTQSCKWLKNGNIPVGGCKNQNENLVATQIAEAIDYGLSD